MEKYKICPSCNTKNDPALFECIQCETDLTGVKVTDELTEQMAAQNATEPVTSGRMVRICDCGNKNPANARKCSACNEDISDITPVADGVGESGDKKEQPVSFVLSSLDGKYAFKVPAGETLIGREHEMASYLTEKSYVSRTHARIVCENGELLVENLSNTNFTYVNNRRVMKKLRLQDGDELALGGTNIDGKCQELAAYFLVRIGTCM